MSDLKERLIVALDVPDMTSLEKLVIELGDSAVYYKVGMELFYACAHQVLTFLKRHDKKIFLDLKLHDIPNTVASSMAALTTLGVDMVNVHAIGGMPMMKAAVEAIHNKAAELKVTPPKLIAVTVLTIMSGQDWSELNYSEDIQTQVVHLAKLAQQAGCDGVVASPQESAAIRQACGEGFLIVTPGIRTEQNNADDQSRITTPATALQNGSTHIVVGRPITKAKDIKSAAEAILAQMKEGTKC